VGSETIWPFMYCGCLGGGFDRGWGFDAGLFCAGYPEAGVDVGEDAVAELDFGEAGVLGSGEGAGGFEALPDGFDLVELVVVGEEADFGVVAGCAGGD
jgi:hypothetical protein